MKLIRLYIENFGGLSGYSLEFQQNLTVIEEANGFGKTTLAEFLRAMFYGFPRKAKDPDKNRRQRYLPWDGRICGGNLVFEAEGRQYRVERSFGPMPRNDTFALIDLSTGRRSDRYSEKLGLELFQLDADSFERSTYLPQLFGHRTLSTDSIRSKLTDLVEDSNDIGNYEKAVRALRASRSALVPYRGSGGSVLQASDRISRLQEQLFRTENRQADLQDTEIRLAQLKKRQTALADSLEQVRQEIRAASEAAVTAAVHQQHERLLERKRELDIRCRSLLEKYPAGIPELVAIEAAYSCAARLELLQDRSAANPEDLEAQAFLEKNRGRFEQQLPTPEELAGCRSWCRQLSGLREKIAELAAAVGQPIGNVSVVPTVILLTAAAAGVVSGTALLLRQEQLYGAVVLGVGAAALAGGLFAAVRMTKAQKHRRMRRQEQLAAQRERDRLAVLAEQLTLRIRSFLETYGSVEGTDYYGSLAELERSSEVYRSAQLRTQRRRRELAEHTAEYDRCSGTVNAFYVRAGLTARQDMAGQLLQIRDDRKKWEDLRQNRMQLETELEQFRAENSAQLSITVPEISDSPEELKTRENALSAQLRQCTEELLRQQKNRESLLEQVQLLTQLREELQLWQEKKTADLKKADLLDETVSLLSQAKENLSTAYMDAVHRNFDRYLKKLWGDQAGETALTTDLEVQLERGGQLRNLACFSAGQTDAVMLCMRFALVDALFTGEKPFVVLDDPFINLDDDRTKQALQLLKKLSEDRQIIYLTCNSSRRPQS